MSQTTSVNNYFLNSSSPFDSSVPSFITMPNFQFLYGLPTTWGLSGMILVSDGIGNATWNPNTASITVVDPTLFTGLLTGITNVQTSLFTIDESILSTISQLRVGKGSTSTDQSVCIGPSAKSSGAYSLSVGWNSRCEGNYNTSVGCWTQVNNAGQGNTCVGSNAMVYATSSEYNTVVGAKSLDNIHTSNYNCVLGAECMVGGAFNKITGDYNIAVGYKSMYCNNGTTFTGNHNIGMGMESLSVLTSGEYNVCLGKYTGLSLTTGNSNFCVGNSAGSKITTGFSNISLGSLSMGISAGITGSNNFAAGTLTLSVLTSGYSNTCIGNLSGQFLTTGYENTFIGYWSGNLANTCSNNVGIGAHSLVKVTSGSQNVALGYLSGGEITTGYECVCIGKVAGNKITTGAYNIALGSFCMGAGVGVSGDFNVGVGGWSLNNITTGYKNVGVGRYAGANITTGMENICMGNEAGNKITSGAANIAIGLFCMANTGTTLTTGHYNIGLGYLTLAVITTGSYNTCIGSSSGVNITTAGDTICIGRDSGSGYIEGNDSIFIGHAATGITQGIYQIAIGKNTYCQGSNSVAIGYGTWAGADEVRIGNASITNNHFNGYINSRSDSYPAFRLWKADGTTERGTISYAINAGNWVSGCEAGDLCMRPGTLTGIALGFADSGYSVLRIRPQTINIRGMTASAPGAYEAPLVVNPGAGTSPDSNGIFIRNTTNSANQNAILCLSTGGASAGNPYISFDVAGVQGWSMGIDNAYSDSFRISLGWNSLSATPLFTMNTNGNIFLTPTIDNKRLVLWDGTGTEFYGFGINGGVLRYQTPNSAEHKFYCGVDNPLSMTNSLLTMNSIWVQGTIRSNSLDGGGNLYVYCDNNGVLQQGNAYSDGRLKTDISPLNYGLREVNQMKPIRFEWNDKKKMGDRTQIGLIAQEVMDIVPEVVSKNSDGYYGLDYQKLVPVLINCINELSERVYKLEKDA